MQWELEGASEKPLSLWQTLKQMKGPSRTWQCDLVTGKQWSGFTLSHTDCLLSMCMQIPAPPTHTHSHTNYQLWFPGAWPQTTIGWHAFALLSGNVEELAIWFCGKLYAWTYSVIRREAQVKHVVIQKPTCWVFSVCYMERWRWGMWLQSQKCACIKTQDITFEGYLCT